MKDVCLTRLRKEYRDILKKPIEYIRAAPCENNMLEWHYVIEGVKGTPYEGGQYHGVLLFPREYPFKPPSVLMYTPNGRFRTNTRLCLSMSDFHPETWNTSWAVSTIILGIQTFMQESAPTAGSISSTDAAKRAYARDSMAFNIKDKKFCALFPDLVEAYEAQLAHQPKDAHSASQNTQITQDSHTAVVDEVGIPLWMILLAVVVTLLGILYVVLR